MNRKMLAPATFLFALGIAALMSMPPEPATFESSRFEPAGRAIDALPPTAAGRPAATLPAPVNAAPAQTYLGGGKFKGRVAEVYVKVGENVFLAASQAPAHLRKQGEFWVDIEFPELLADDVGSARALLGPGEEAVQAGDVVEIKFAHKDNPRFFPVKELTRVTELVARKDDALARDFERRILARNGRGAAAPNWLAHAQPLPAGAAPEQHLASAGSAR